MQREQKQLAINAARAVCLEGVCAIDMMVCNKTDNTCVIEANGNGSLNGIEKITGENVAGAIRFRLRLTAFIQKPEALIGYIKKGYLLTQIITCEGFSVS